MISTSKTIYIQSLNLDSWSETYIGALWLVNNVLPEKHYESKPEHGSLSKMVLIASNQMIEIMLFSLIKESVKNHSKFKYQFDKYLKMIKNNNFMMPLLRGQKTCLMGRRFL